jgi:hypothetical protein
MMGLDGMTIFFSPTYFPRESGWWKTIQLGRASSNPLLFSNEHTSSAE